MVRPALLLLLCACAGPVLAQEEPHAAAAQTPVQDTVLLPRNTAGIVVDRNLNTFSWGARALIDTAVAGIRMNVREQYTATVVQLDTDPGHKIQNNQQQAGMTFNVPATGALSAVGRWNSFVFTDSRVIQLNKSSTHSLLGGLEFGPSTSFTITPLAGYRWDTQSEFHDRGPAYQVGSSIHAADLDGYALGLTGQYHLDRLSPRRLESHFVIAGIEKQFSPQTVDSLTVGYVRQRREFYAADSSIESRRENLFNLANTLAYQIDPSVQTVIFFGIGSRVLDKVLEYAPTARPLQAFDTEVHEFHLDSYVEGRWRSPGGRSDATLRFGYSERNELHSVITAEGQSTGTLLSERVQQEDSKNNLSQRTMIAGTLRFPLSQSDEVTLATSANLLRYDTPSSLNLEDRDELLIVSSIGTRHHLSPAMDLGIVLEGSLSHLVYLLAERSANNNINRVLRLSPFTLYHPTRWFATSNAFEVLASYTVYDFELEQSTVQSYSYRQFGWSDSSSIELTSRVGVDVMGALKLYERGQLNWADFKERTENSYVDRNVAAQIRFVPNDDLFMAVGVRHFSQTRYAYDPVLGKQLDAYYRSIGPTCTVVWSPGMHSQIAFRGWYENRLQADGSLRGLATMTMQLHLLL